MDKNSTRDVSSIKWLLSASASYNIMDSLLLSNVL